MGGPNPIVPLYSLTWKMKLRDPTPKDPNIRLKCKFHLWLIIILCLYHGQHNLLIPPDLFWAHSSTIDVVFLCFFSAHLPIDVASNNYWSEKVQEKTKRAWNKGKKRRSHRTILAGPARPAPPPKPTGSAPSCNESQFAARSSLRWSGTAFPAWAKNKTMHDT